MNNRAFLQQSMRSKIELYLLTFKLRICFPLLFFNVQLGLKILYFTYSYVLSRVSAIV